MARREYAALRAVHCSSDPRMRETALDSSEQSQIWVPWHGYQPRVIALHSNRTGSFDEPCSFTNAAELAQSFSKARAPKGAPLCSVYLLEGMSPDFVSVLGNHFQIHPSLFMDHERLCSCDPFSTPSNGWITRECGGIPFLPSAISGRGHISLKYHQPLIFDRPFTGFRNFCGTSGRHIAVTRLRGGRVVKGWDLQTQMYILEQN